MIKRIAIFLERIKYYPAPFLRTLFSVLLGIAFGLSVYYTSIAEFTAVIAGLSVVASLVSAWIAFETFHRIDLAKRPQINIDFDLESRHELIQLVVENRGEQPAYNLNFQWNKPIIREDGRELNIAKSGHSDYDIPIIGAGQKLYYIVGRYGERAKKDFFKIHSEGELQYEGYIRYQLDRKGLLRLSELFFLSLDQYRKTTDYANNKTFAYYQIGGNLSQLRKISGHLKTLIGIVSSKPKSKDKYRKSLFKKLWDSLLS